MIQNIEDKIEYMCAWEGKHNELLPCGTVQYVFDFYYTDFPHVKISHGMGVHFYNQWMKKENDY